MPSPLTRKRSVPDGSPAARLAAVAALALAVRLLYLLLASDLPAFHYPGMDAEIYQRWAGSLLAGEAPPGPYYRGPLYPSLIALLASLFQGDSFWPIRLLQVIGSSAAAAGLSWLAGRWFGSAVGWIAGLGWALYGLSIYYDGEGLIASLFASTLVLLFLLLERYRIAPRWWWAPLLGAGLGAITLLRANGLILWPVILGGLLLLPLTAPASASAKQRRLHTLLALIVATSCITPTLLHNQRHGGGLQISVQGGINLFLGNHQGASGAHAVDPQFGDDWTFKQIHLRAEEAVGRPLTPAEVSDHYAHRALDYWLEQPLDALKLTGRKALLLLNHREVANNRVLTPYLNEVHPLFHLLVLLGFPIAVILALPALPGIWRRLPASRPAIAFLLLHALTLLPFFIAARYRFPLSPFLVLFAAAGGVRLLHALRHWRGRDRWPLLLGTLFVAGLVLLPRPLGDQRHDEALTWQLHQGNALLRAGKPVAARAHFYNMLALSPGARRGHLNLAVTFLHSGQLDSAEHHLHAELRAHPASADVLNNLGVIAQRRGHWEQAQAHYLQALKADPTHDDAAANLAAILDALALEAAESQDPQHALHLLDLALSYRPDHPTYLYHRALILAEIGDREEARATLLRLLEIEPENTLARSALQNLKSKQEDPAPR